MSFILAAHFEKDLSAVNQSWSPTLILRWYLKKKAALVFIEQEIFKVLPLHQMIHGFWVKVRVVESALSHPSKMVEHYTCVQPLQPEFVSGSQEIFVMTVASCEI